MMSSNSLQVLASNCGESLDIQCLGIGNGIENAQSKIIRPDVGINFHPSKFHFLKGCGAHFICSKGCFPKRFGTYVVCV